ncbi:serine threonine protein kinase CMGC group [Coemansia brasiliensis]|uniref:Serine threonine protein kinase CMGC group n=1 Tax=Coemansia brasiliensis TaxID=2650707 RepID=A0A9W8IAY2_9FUNG|nr:serine threonine protein kinase CMGC group [Coemansia brasiliensis]
MSVLSFVTSLFRPRNHHADNHSVSDATNDASQSNGDAGTNHRLGIHRTLSKHALKLTATQTSAQRKPRRFTPNYDQPNDLRQIFPDAKNNPRLLMPKPNGNGINRRAQQKGDASCDDRDGHYIVVPGREFTPRFKIRRLLGQGTFGKVMECEDNSTGRLVAIKVIRAVPKYRDAAKIEIRVLQTLQRSDPSNMYQCMHVNETFDHRNHVCMVFDLLGPSVFDFLKENEFRPFSLHHVQLFAEQLLRSVAFLHSLNLVHTDLKPENILLENGDYDVVPFGSSQTVKTRMLRSTNIRLIDFGSATFNNEYHSQVVSTRHYRAPEIILNLGWSFPCDMWSIGCIILELLTGEALFQTHDNNEHLAMMEVVVGRAPAHITRTVAPDLRAKFFRADGTARYPGPEQTRQSSRGLRSMRPLSQLVNPATNPIYANLHDLLFRLLQYDPQARITAKEACEHPFFRYRVGPDGRLVSRPPSQQQQQQQRVLEPQSVGLADLVPSPSSASASLSHHRSFRPSYAVPQPATGPYTYTGANAATAARAPMRVGDYSLAAAAGGVAPPAVSQQQQQQHPVLPALKAAISNHHYRDSQMVASPHSPYVKEFSDHLTPQHYYASQPSRADTYSWQHAAAAGVAPQLSSSSTTGYETSGVQPLQQPVRSGAGKRKAGVPVDSGYFPEATSSGEATSYFGPSSHSGSSITSAGAQQQQQLPPPPQSSRGYFPPSAPYPSANYAAASAKSSHLPPISTHAYPQQQQYTSSASVTTAGAAVVPGANMTQQPHHPYTNSYQHQRHYPFAVGSMNAAGPPSASGNGAMPPVRLLPLDANTTPTLTMATTATPTPNSTSHLSGSHSMENVVPSTIAAAASVAVSGSKPSVRSLPSLVGGNTLNPNASHVSSISSEFARASLKEQQPRHGHAKLQHPPSASPMSQQVPGRSSFYQLPPAQALLQPHQSNSVSSLDYAHHQQFAPPSSANNSSY